jgi:hypothetical protein
MTLDALKRRLEQGKPFDYSYSEGGKEGLISIWRHGERFILTWEESEHGGQLDESQYSRDERQEFSSAEQVADYLLRNAEMNRLIELQMEGSVG